MSLLPPATPTSGQPEAEAELLEPAPLFTGACLCRAVRFALLAPPERVGNCYCPDCQKNAGGPGQTYAICPNTSMRITDPQSLSRVYVVLKTGSGKSKEKHFCAGCGCTLWTVVATRPGARVVRVGLIDGGLQRLLPQVELFTSRRPGWIPPVPGADQWESAPPAPD
ncbi:hypothetical protein CALCODRAFT_427707 [Calocera cornea HHB12733]|uniref:CENP-V/GFA domain-containing protein n=1 Tax=Calocera cornea HHB12733 TaxID=1353952 RepID=A0A165J5T1_9BASI|nr:hypothetical protein CALCODRAFT_427707 [Calocera cornea HHB12733]